MGHQAFDYSIWERSEAPNYDKLKHSHRFEMKQKKKRDHDEWDEWDEWND